jgi:hypothetical protein
MSEVINDNGQSQPRIKISADFTSTMLIAIGGSILSLMRYLEEKKVDGLYTEAWFLGILLFLLAFLYFFTRPKVYFDSSNLYCKRINKSEIRIPLKNIHSIFNNLFFMGRGIYFYEIEYLDENKEIEKIKFQTDKGTKQVKDFKELVKKNNPSVEIV